MENNSLGSVKLEKLERIIESIKNHYKDRFTRNNQNNWGVCVS